MATKRFFIPITKVDKVKKEVWGTFASEILDRDGEVFDYDSSKPYVEAWSNIFSDLTKGGSVGNLRAMHGNVAAGKLIKIDFDDTNKTVSCGARVVDANEWEKCAEGVYTGFSVGGDYVKRWSDGVNKRYTADPSEVSLVDFPANPDATFEYVKGMGSSELRKFSTLEKKAKYLVTEDDGTTHLPYTDEDGSPNHRLMGAAWAALHGGYRGKKYQGPDKDKAIERLTAVYEREKMDTPSTKSALPRLLQKWNEFTNFELPEKLSGLIPLAKGLWAIQDTAGLLAQMDSIRMSAVWEKASEGDDSQIPEKLHALVVELCEILKEMVDEETGELVAISEKSMEGKGMKIGDLAKATGDLLNKAGSDHEGMCEKMHKAHGDMGDALDKLHKFHKAKGKGHADAFEELKKAHEALGEHLEKYAKLGAPDAEDKKDDGDDEEAEKARKAAELQKTAAPAAAAAPPAPANEELTKAVDSKMAKFDERVGGLEKSVLGLNDGQDQIVVALANLTKAVGTLMEQPAERTIGRSPVRTTPPPESQVIKVTKEGEAGLTGSQNGKGDDELLKNAGTHNVKDALALVKSAHSAGPTIPIHGKR